MEAVLKYIESFAVRKMWGRMDVDWKKVNKDVNILVGINGCGKTTLLNLIYDYYGAKKKKTNLAAELKGNDINIPVTYIRSFDVPSNVKKKTESVLLQDLKQVVNQNGEGTSFFDYRMKMLNFPDKAPVIKERIDHFFKRINTLFAETNKEIMIDPISNNLVFRVVGTQERFCDSEGKGLCDSDGEAIRVQGESVQLEQLSSGEKQMLLILTTVFLQEEKPNILLMDEPEISLHISWQEQLIVMLRKMNPHCQLILTTHSPSIFVNGWEDKIVFMEDLEGIDNAGK